MLSFGAFCAFGENALSNNLTTVVDEDLFSMMNMILSKYRSALDHLFVTGSIAIQRGVRSNEIP